METYERDRLSKGQNALNISWMSKGTVESYIKSDKDADNLVDIPFCRKPVLSPQLENEME